MIPPTHIWKGIPLPHCKEIPSKGEVPILEIAHSKWDLQYDGGITTQRKIITVKGLFSSNDFRIYLPESIVELNIGDSHSLPCSFEDPMQASKITIITSIESYLTVMKALR